MQQLYHFLLLLFLAVFLAPFFFEAAFFLDGAFLALFLEALFFDADFFAPFFFGGGTLSPSFLASDIPIAIACLRLVTFFPLLPLFNFPCFISSITFFTLCWLFLPYFAIIEYFALVNKEL